MKKRIAVLLSLILLLSLAACGKEESKVDAQTSATPETETTQPETEKPETTESSEIETEPALDAPVQESEHILVVYFSMPDNVDTSTVEIDGETLGNTQYMAYVIQENTGADLFRIEPETPYPMDHEALVDLAQQEQNEDARPAIAGSIEDFESYDTVFIGYPIWWGDFPQIMYTFFDVYDFSGKTIIPFNTHGGSGFAGTPQTIAKLEPGAIMLDGLSISRNTIQDGEAEIIAWLQGLGFTN